MAYVFGNEKEQKELVNKATAYLNKNFHKFSQTNKIKVALEIFKRTMPAQIDHSGEIKGMAPRIVLINHNQVSEKTGVERVVL